MAFPTTGTIDDFNRADGSLGVNWTGDIFAAAWEEPDVASNLCKVDASNPFSNAWYNVAQYGPDCEVWCDIVVTPTAAFRLYARVQNPGTGSQDGYELETDTINFYIVKDVDTARTTLQTIFGEACASGDSIGLEVTGSASTTLRAYKKPSGGSWAQIGTDQVDSSSPVTGAGFMGLCFVNDSVGGTRISNFSGGNVNTGGLAWVRA